MLLLVGALLAAPGFGLILALLAKLSGKTPSFASPVHGGGRVGVLSRGL
jgi:hypothetical protein